MTTSRKYAVRVLATGFMVLVLFSIPLFWGRYFCAVSARAALPGEARYIRISPSGVLSEAVENDPNVDRPSSASAQLYGSNDLRRQDLGLLDYIGSKWPGGHDTNLFYYDVRDKNWMYFDRAAGQIVFRDVHYKHLGDTERIKRVTQPFYAGPKGITDVQGRDLGRFVDPMVERRGGLPELVYDRGLRRFFVIERDTMTVRSGPELKGLKLTERAQIASSPYSRWFSVDWRPTMRRVHWERQEDSQEGDKWLYNMYFNVDGTGRYVPIIDASGRIDVLDRHTLELVIGKGTLPAPVGLYARGSIRPDQLLAYGVIPVCIGQTGERQYTGLVAGSVSRQGTSMSLAVFDEDGKRIGSGDSEVVSYRHKAMATESAVSSWFFEQDHQQINLASPSVASAGAVYSEVPGGPLLSVCQYVVENLHPLGLTIASFCAVPHIEAKAGHRALFLMPNSFAAQLRDYRGHNIVTRFSRMLMLMLPAVFLAIILAWRVVRDAANLGLSRSARTFWLVATLALGIPAYLTYRRTRPEATLVTCANCGLTRRPDMERCHHCNARWELSELRPPAWRVLDEGQAVCEMPPISNSEAAAE